MPASDKQARHAFRRARMPGRHAFAAGIRAQKDIEP